MIWFASPNENWLYEMFESWILRQYEVIVDVLHQEHPSFALYSGA